MQLAALQKAAAQAIVNVFETGSVRGEYGNVTLLPGDTGLLTYGRSQTTLASGNLFLLIQDYCQRSDGQFSADFRSYLPKLEACDASLDHDLAFRGLLKDAGGDPVMQDVQDVFFDRVYWEPAMRSADALGAQSALGATIVYDSTVHGSWARVRDRTRQQFGELRDIGEDTWMAHYVDTRRDWLATYPNALLHKTVYRMDAFKQIIQAGNWKLRLPLSVRGLTITPDALAFTAPVKVPAEGTPRRQLRLKTPPMTGPDVSWLQERLTRAGIRVAESGIFDAPTDAAVKAFQEAHDMKVDGVVGPVTRTALEDIPVTSPVSSASATADEPMPAVPQPKAPPRVMPSVVSPPASPPVSPPPVAPPSVAPPAPSAGAGGELAVNMLKGVIAKGRPGLAAGASAVILALTEARDAIAWVRAGPWSTVIKPGTPGNPIPTAPQAPQSSADFMRFLSDAYSYVQGLAAALPNEWVFRIRMIAFALICYAVYRFVMRHFDIRRLQNELAQARQVAQQAQQIAQEVRQAVK